MKKNTQELLEILNSTDKIQTYLSDFPEVIPQEPLSPALEKLLSEKGLKKSRCIKDSGLPRTYAYQIFSGERTPSRDKLLALCLAMHLTPKEVHTLFSATGYPDLYAKNQRDSVFIFAFNKHLSPIETNELLMELKMDLMEI